MTQHIETSTTSGADVTYPPGAGSFSRDSQRNTRAGYHRLLLFSAALFACGFYCASATAACKTSTGESSGPVIPSTVTGSGAGDADDGSIVGVWHVCFFDDTGAVFDEGFDMWNQGGTELLNDTLPPPLPPFSTGFFCEGVYVRAGPRMFNLRHPAWTVDGTGAISGTAVFLEEVTLAKDGKSYSGKFRETVYDLDGHIVMGGDVSGTLLATRITPN